MKRFIALFLLFTSFTICSYASVSVNGIFYNLKSETSEATVTNANGTIYSGDISIPSTFLYQGVIYTVTGIGGYAFDNCSKITSVTIPNTVTSIGTCAFYGCKGLSSVSIPSAVTSIGSAAFSGCTGIKSVNIPNRVTKIGDYTFYNCGNLTSIDIPHSVTSIGTEAFYNCLSLTSITIPNSVTSIGEKAFYGCTGIAKVNVSCIDNNDFCNYLQRKDAFNVFLGGRERSIIIAGKEQTIINIPDEVTTIGDDVFYGCTNITSVVVPNTVTHIGEYAFCDCTKLNSISIGNSVVCIGESAFEGCRGLTSVFISDISAWCNISFDIYDSNPLYHAHNLYLNGEIITDLVIPGTVTSIGTEAFRNCTCLKSVSIPSTVTNIGGSAFSGCSGLTSITIPNSVTNIGSEAFCNCSSLTSITIPNSVTSLNSRLFKGCTNLATITIPNSVSSIGYDAFSECKIVDVYCYAKTVPTTNSFVFTTSNTLSATLHVPTSALQDYKATTPWSYFGTIVEIISDNMELFDGIAYSNANVKTCDELKYTRTFNEQLANKWNALYVPMSINIEDYLDDFDFAEIFNISPTEDTNGDGEIDGKDANKLIVNKLKMGTTVPNKPYLIRPKNAGTYTFASADNVLYPAEEKSYTCSTMTDEYTFTGLYASKDVTGNGQYYMTINGVLDFSPTKTITVKPNRWIMTVKSRNGSSSSSYAKAISLSVIGEDEGTTAIEHVNAVRNADVIYNLNGIKMDSMNLPAGIYVKNGKKVFVK